MHDCRCGPVCDGPRQSLSKGSKLRDSVPALDLLMWMRLGVAGMLPVVVALRAMRPCQHCYSTLSPAALYISAMQACILVCGASRDVQIPGMVI